MRVKQLDLNLSPKVSSKEVKARRRVLSRTLEGAWNAFVKGQGMEFAGFRKYTFGDDASRIDWGASLRAKDTLVREFEEYKNVNVLFLFDVSDSMLLSSQKKLKAEYAAEIIFEVSLAILDNGDSVGYAMFSDRVVNKQMPGVGSGLVSKMSYAFMDPRNYGGKKRFDKVMGVANAFLSQPALVILVSDFINLGKNWEQYIRMIAQKFDIIGIMVRDPRDAIFPETASQFLLEDPLSGERIYVDVQQCKEIFEEHAQKEEEYIKNVFSSVNASCVKIDTSNNDLLYPILHHFQRRKGIIKG
ncbi:MAG: DUF58 domain-containing protein [Candidatus Woesearchaeota archaeon]|nr:DUF58 domain-containing protein [Candidatus Woesearchaeota archaeon]